MAPSKKGRSKASSKSAATTRTTRAKSKEAAALPAPIAPARRSTRAASREAQAQAQAHLPSQLHTNPAEAVTAAASAALPPSRRSTRATSNEPLLHVNEPDKILRKPRKTPEPHVATTVPTPIVEDAHEDDVHDPGAHEDDAAAPSSPSPVIETFENDVAPSSPSVLLESHEQDNVPSSQSSLVKTHGHDGAAARSSPVPSTPVPASLSPVFVNSERSEAQSASPVVPASLDYPNIEEDTSVSLGLAPSPATPTSCVHIEPSQVGQISKSGGFFSRFTSILTTPVTKVTGFFAGAKTQPIQKVGPLQQAKQPSTPNTPLFASVANAQQATPETLFADILPLQSQSKDNVFNNSKATSFLGRITITPRRKTSTTDPSGAAARSVLYAPDGEKIPTEYRYWPVGRCQKQLADMTTLRLLNEEVDQGVRVLTLQERQFKDETLRRQYYYELWRARQPGNRAKLTPAAGQKHGTDDLFPDEAPNKRARADLTPVGYNCPTPLEPKYHHIHEDASSTPVSHVFTSESPLGALGSKSTVRTGSSTFAVPDEDDGDVEMVSEKPADSDSVSQNPPNWVGIPDWVYDDTDSDDEELPITSTASSSAAVSVEAPVEVSAEPTAEPSIESPTVASATPFVHKYTPAKPSGLRAVETVSSSPAILTPPHSPKTYPDKFPDKLPDSLLRLVDSIDWQAAFPASSPQYMLDMMPLLDWSDLAERFAEAYIPMICSK